MCCYAYESSKARLLKRFGKRKTMVLWKQVRRRGTAECCVYQYSPGVHIARTQAGKPWNGRYRVESPLGIHVFSVAPRHYDNLHTIPVIVHRGDLIRADAYQAVFRKVRILKKDWLAVGLPLEKVKA